MVVGGFGCPLLAKMIRGDSMRDLIISIFGTYTPVTDAAGTALQGMAGVDWPYLAGVALFALVLYSFFRLLGVVFKR